MYRSSPSLSTLITLLERQQNRFEAFLALLDKERTAIKTLASASLVEISEAKLNLLEDIRLLDEQRSAAVARLAGNWGVEADSLTLRAIAQRVGPIEAGTLVRLHERLNKTVAAVRDSTGLNGDLIARSLAFLNQGLEVWRSSPNASALYSMHGALKSSVTQPTFVEQKG
jgi:flagellar biosynthesis/type III secretory pathway chaperone